MIPTVELNMCEEVEKKATKKTKKFLLGMISANFFIYLIIYIYIYISLQKKIFFFNEVLV